MNADNFYGYTEKYFCEEINRLRKKMGDRSFWEIEKDKRERYLDGLSLVYLNILNDDFSNPDQTQIDKWASIYGATMDEYRRRELFIEVGI